MTGKRLLAILILVVCAVTVAARTPFVVQEERAAGSGEWACEPGPLASALPLSALVLHVDGGFGDALVEVAQVQGAPFLPIYLHDGTGRLPLAVPDVGAMRRLHFRFPVGIPGQVVLEPESDFALIPGGTPGLPRAAVTYWGETGLVEVSAADASGQSLEVISENGRGIGPELDGWRSIGTMSPGEGTALLAIPQDSTAWPVTIRLRSESGDVAEVPFYRSGLPGSSSRDEAGSGICGDPGKDGAGGTLTGIVNTYYPVTASVSAGATSIPVGTSAGAATAISAGDLLILIQMQDAAINSANSDSYGDGVSGGNASGYTALNGTGKYEFVRAAGIIQGGSVPVIGAGTSGGTLNAYTVAASTSTKGQSSVQVVRVPQYTTATLSATLTCKAWDGSTGGILAMDVSGALTLGGTVSVNGLGFRGGAEQNLTGITGVTTTDYRVLGPASTSATAGTGGMKGEGIGGTPRLLANSDYGTGLDGYPNGDNYRGAPGNAGGGGNDGTPTTNNQNAGGGGGGNGGIGGTGGNTWSSNLAYGGYPGTSVANAANLLVMGGGGGAGSRNNLSAGGDASGGPGGGIVFIRAGSVTGTGTITANGSAGGGTYGYANQDAAGGGGAGGTILVYATSGTLSGLTVQANGGKGANAWPADTGGTADRHGPGGGGGGGAILLSAAPASSSVTGGANGTTTTLLDAYGSTAGSAGTVATTVTGTQIPGTDSGAECPSPANYITKTCSAGAGYVSPGQTLTYRITVNNTTASAWTNVAVTDTLPSTLTYVASSSQVRAPTSQAASYSDLFDTAGSYAGTDGTITWSGTPWAEIGETDGASAGNVRVLSDTGVTPNVTALRITGLDFGASRAADLTGFQSATLTFNYRRVNTNSACSLTADISNDGGATFATTLITLSGSTTDTAYQASGSLTIPAGYLGSNFVVRFYKAGTNGTTTRYFYIDNVAISGTKRTVTTASASAPPSLITGYTLNAGESLVVTFQATVSASLANTVTSIANTGTVTATTGINQSATVTNPVLAAPVITAPIVATASSISGTCSAPVGSTITVYKNGTSIGTTTILTGGTWSLAGVSGLTAGDSITAASSSGGSSSPLSNAVIVLHPAPVVTSPIASGATSISGTSTSPVGATITVYKNGTSIGTTAVLTGGTWSLSGVSGLVGGESITAKAGTGTSQSAASNTVVVTPSAPVVTSPIVAGATTVSGTSTAPVGSTVTVYVGATPYTTTVLSGGTWTVTVPALAGGSTVYATVTAGGQTSANSNTVTVQYPAPVVTSPISAGATSISGTSTSAVGTTITVYKNGTSIGTTTVLTGGTWTLSGVSGLVGGESITAKAGTGASQSAASNTVVVTPASPVITTPLVEGATTVSGTSTAPVGATITVTIGSNNYTTTVLSGGTWTVTVPALAGGATVSATVTTGGQTSAAASTTVTFHAPVVTSPILAGATSISGTSTSPVGTTITVYKNGTSMGTTTVLTGGTWTLSGVSGLVGGESITATAGTGGSMSASSAAVVVTPSAPVVNGPIAAGATSVSGTSTAPVGSTVTVYVGATPYTTTVLSGGTWTVTVPAVAAGATIYATVTAGGQTSANSNTVTVQYPAPVVASPISAGATSISGTSTAGTGVTITVYKNGTSIGTTTVLAGGTWTLSGVSGLVGGESITAKAGTGASQSAASNTVVVTPSAPVVNSPIVAGATTVSGTSTAPVGSTVTVYVGATPYTTTVLSGGTWTVTVPALAGGSTVYATVTAGGQVSANSNTVTVAYPAPVVTSPIVAGAVSISGTSTAGTGVMITVYKNGTSIGTTTVLAGGTWTLSGVSGLVGGESITATAGTGASQSGVSNAVVVTPSAPVVNSPIVAGATTVSGTSTAPVGSTVTVYVGATPYTTTVLSGGTWTVTVPALAGGSAVYATVTAGGQVSANSNTVTVAFAAPVVSSPILAGASNISGTSSAAVGTTITVYKNGTSIGTTTVLAGGTWTLSGVSGLVGGESITATAGTGGSQSGVSNAVVVTPSAPVVNGPISAGATSVSGTSTAPLGSTVTVYVGATPYTTTVLSGGTWTVTVPALAGGSAVYATVTAGGQVSANSSSLTVAFAAPVVSSPILAGASNISGTSSAAVGTTITVYKNGTSIGTTTVLAGGTWTLSGVSGLVGGESITATAGTSGSMSGLSNSVVVTPAAPSINAPLMSGQTSVTGTSTAPVGSTVTVYVNGTPYTTTVLSGGTWTVTVPALAGGSSVYATVTAGGQVSANSSSLTVAFAAPVVSSPILAGASSISGTSTSAVGTTITIYKNGTSIGTTTVLAGGTWTLSGVSGLAGGESITATAGTGASQSAVSNAVVVTPSAPSINAPLMSGQTSVTGTSTAPVGSTITVYVGATPYTTTVLSGGTWTVTVPALAGGDQVYATATAGGQVSANSNTVTVTVSVELPPQVAAPIRAGAVVIAGLSPSAQGTFITVYKNGVEIGKTQVLADASWYITGEWGLIGGESITAKAGKDASLSGPSNIVVVTPDAPVIHAPLMADDVVVTGTSTAPAGSTVTVYVNGTPHTSTVQAGGTWSVPVPALVAGQQVYAHVTANGETSANSSTETVHYHAPVVNAPLYATASTIQGTANAPAGTTITVYDNGTPIGTATVLASGWWTLGGVSGLSAGDAITAAAGTGASQSTVSNTVLVQPPQTLPPIVSAPLTAGPSQTVTGSSVEAPGTSINIYYNGSYASSVTVQADGTWSWPGVPLSVGDYINATAQAPGLSVSGFSNTVIVSDNSAGAVTPEPTITPGVLAGATAVSGTYPTPMAGVVIDVYADGVYLGTTTTAANGSWTLNGLSPLANGAILSATATQSGEGTSDWSAPVIVGTLYDLLRSDAMTSLHQPISMNFVRKAPQMSAMDPLGAKHRAAWGEGTSPQPEAPGSSDGDKAYAYGVASGYVDQDATVLSDNGRPLVFYELFDNGAKTIYLTKTGDGKIKITITP